ncbi:MAG: prolipoprotein diacylglyceryl transferase family protein [Patescibacteria group bacterium]
MNFFIVFLLAGLFISLFSVYYLSRDDLILLRKDVTIEKIFNLAFVVFFAGLFFARLFYGILYSAKIFLNPLKFFLFPYFPGLSLTGGTVGGILLLFLVCRSKNFPTGRIFDIFSISILSCLSLGYLGFFLLSGQNLLSVKPIFLIIIYIVLFYVFIKYIHQYLLKGILRDGSGGLLFLISFSTVSLIVNIVDKLKNNPFLGTPENPILFIILVLSAAAFIKQEKLIKFPQRRSR